MAVSAPDEPEQRQDEGTRDRVGAVLKATSEDRKRLDRHLTWVERAVLFEGLVLVLVSILLGGVPLTGYGGLTGANAQRAREARETAVQLELVVRRLGTLVERIQAERRRNILTSCIKQNVINQKTIEKYDRNIEAARASGLIPKAQLRRLAESRKFTVDLINTLAAREDCFRRLGDQAPSAEVAP